METERIHGSTHPVVARKELSGLRLGFVFAMFL